MALQMPSLTLHQQIQQCVRNFQFQRLFIELLNWNKPKERFPLLVPVDVQTYKVIPLAEKANLVVYGCVLDMNDPALSQHKIRAEIDRQVALQRHERILIFSDTTHTKQFWLWVKREPGRPMARREEHFERNQSGERLTQKLEHLHIGIQEEEGLTISTVTGKVSRAFDSEPMTKKFFKLFTEERKKFFDSVKGIDLEKERHWYTTLMLCRLMLVYFIQKKSLLNGEQDYLQKRMKDVKERYGDEEFYAFYRKFLLRLFHEGFASNVRTQELNDLLKEVPYLNGSLFDKRELEEKNLNIQIPDETFKSVLEFLSTFTWHLDNRPLHKDDEINPDVLGYIFEQLVNEAENKHGAYYTKEDITEYIAKNTILTYLLRTVAQKYPEAFVPEGFIWSWLQLEPERYIYDAMSKGHSYPLPTDIREGISDITKRLQWNDLAPDDVDSYALPTEIWRDVVERRKQYELVYKKLADGEVQSIDDLITYNLDISQFVQDVLDNCEDVRLLHTFYFTIAGMAKTSRTNEQLAMSILDPTCGSGAFLLSAVNILQPVYQACLQRMQSICDETRLWKEKPRTPYMLDFEDVLAQMKNYPNQDFFIIKSIIVNNLYGVDIMKEATEICKLRLFLKLMAYVDSYEQAKPLPNVDFNIYTGNSLVGFVDMEAARKLVLERMDSKLFSEETLQRIEETVKEVEQDIEDFRIIQMEPIPQLDYVRGYKRNIERHTRYLRRKLNRYLASEYAIDSKHIQDARKHLREFKEWEKTHQPFHWFMEFQKVIKNGGFSVIIGNPPYIELAEVKKRYKPIYFETLACGNTYALVLERCVQLTQPKGRNGMIVQLPAICTDRMIPLQNLLKQKSSTLWLSTFDDRPAKLFNGLQHIRATIIINEISQAPLTIWSTKYNRWYSQVREGLFKGLRFSNITTWNYRGTFPKVGTQIEEYIVEKLQSNRSFGTNATGEHKVYFHNAPEYWVHATSFKPYFWNERGKRISSQIKTLRLLSKIDALVTTAVINSSLFYWWFILVSDCRHLNMREIEHFPLDLTLMNDEYKEGLSGITQRLMEDYEKHTARKETRNKHTGTVVYDEFHPKYSKSIIDDIDRILAQHYGFTDEELDFLINYDIKYRMGKQQGTDDDE